MAIRAAHSDRDGADIALSAADLLFHAMCESGDATRGWGVAIFTFAGLVAGEVTSPHSLCEHGFQRGDRRGFARNLHGVAAAWTRLAGRERAGNRRAGML
jgi:hypothetical protein